MAHQAGGSKRLRHLFMCWVWGGGSAATCRGNLRPPPQPNPQRPGLPGEEVASKVLGQAGEGGVLVPAAPGPLPGEWNPMQQVGTS